MKSLGARLNLQADEAPLVAVLVALAFCVGLTRLFNATASSTLFLVNFDASSLPYIYILVAVVIPLIGFLNTRLEAQVPLIALLAGNLLGYLLVMAGLRLAMAFTTHPWPVFALSVWSEVGWVVTNLTLWGLAGRLLNVRQAKRLFGVIGAAGVAAAVGGGLLMPTLVGLIGTPNLLWGSVTTLALAFILLLYAARTFKGAAAITPEPLTPAAQSQASSSRARYIVLIVALGMLSYAAFYFVDNIFYREVQQQFANEAQLASFVGVFLAAMNLLTMLANLFLVGPLIGRFGMRVGLLLMPGLTALISGAMAVAGFALAIPSLLFGLAVLNDLFDWVLRDTVFKTAVLILYQPLPPSLRLRVQTLVESVAQPIAQGLAGLALLGLSLLAFNTLQVNLVLLVILAACVVLAVLLGREYGPALLSALSRRALHFDGPALVVNDATSLEILHVQLISPVPAAVSYAFDKLEELGDPALPGFLLDWLNHDSPEVRKDVLLRVERLQLKSATAGVRELLKKEKSPTVKGAALRALAALENEGAVEQVKTYLDDTAPTVRVGALVGLVRSGGVVRAEAIDQLAEMAEHADPAQRLEAAQVLGRVGQGRHAALVLQLLKDADPAVRRAAVTAAGQMHSQQLWPAVVDALHNPVTREDAVGALLNGGNAALLSLQAALAQPDLPPTVGLRLLRIVGRIRGEAAIVLLKKWLRHPNPELRHQALAELERCHYQADAKDMPKVEAAIEVEAREAAETLTALRDIQTGADADAPLERALQEQVDAQQAAILSLLSFLINLRMFARVRASLQHPAPDQRAYGLEVLESLLSKELKAWALPLIEALPADKTLARLPLNPARQPRADRLHALIGGPRWVATCARYALGETAMLSLIEKVLTLRTVSIFAGVPESILAEVAVLLEESSLKPGETLFSKDEGGDCLYIIVEGRLKVHDGDRVLSQLDDRDVVGEMAVLDSSPRLASVTAETPTTLLKLDQGALYELMADRIEVARGIIHVLTRRLRQSMRDLSDLQSQLDLHRQ